MSSLADTPRRLAELAHDIRALGFDHIETFAWRDLDDPDAGGSEVHADHVLRRITEAGMSVSHRTSCKTSARVFERNGYQVTQRGSRYGVFPRVILRNVFRRRSDSSIVVEIWNGVPWFARLWARGPRVTVMHHIHEDMWRDSLPRLLAPLGRALEVRVAPRFYKDAPLITLAHSTREQLISRGFHPDKVHVAHPGIDRSFFVAQPNGVERLESPLLVAVGRLAPVKRFDLLIHTFDTIRQLRPDARLVIIGEGPEEQRLKQLVEDRGLSSSVTLAGRVDRDELIATYREAALLVSMSHSEGWGMTITEAAASGTPCVVTDNIGHQGAVVDNHTGLLVADDATFAQNVVQVLGDSTVWAAMSTAAFAHSQSFSWDTCAEKILQVIHHEVRRHAADT
jgi:glycosyltransferase involved in cell wall biosynthesis